MRLLPVRRRHADEISLFFHHLCHPKALNGVGGGFSLLHPAQRRLLGALWEVLLEAWRELKEFNLRGVLQLCYFRVGLDGQVGAVLRVLAVDPVDLFVELKEVALPALATSEKVPPEVAILAICFEQFERS